MAGTEKIRYVSNERLKFGLFKKMLKLLQDSQCSNRGRPLKELKKLYYRQTNPAEVKEYQKVFFGLTWQAMLIPFREQTCKAQQRMMSFYTSFVLTAGTEEDMMNFDFDIKEMPLPPFYTYFIRNYAHHHSDVNSLIRLRLIQIVHHILEKKHEESFLRTGKSFEKLKDAISERIKDKSNAVRVVALRCAAFLVQEDNDIILRQVRFHAEHDLHLDARKAAIQTYIKTAVPVASNFLVKTAFDVNESVRMEAFKALVKVPFGKIRTSYRSRLLQWGLMQDSEKITNIVTNELIPSWIAGDTCENDLSKLLMYLDISRNPDVGEALLRSLFPDNSENTFEKVDLSFLSADKLIPLNVLTLEKIIYWRYLCCKFKGKPYCIDKVLPDPVKLVEFIESLIQLIHEESERARAESVDEEFEKVLCLAEVLKIAGICEYEEGSRLAMETTLRKILQDNDLDEVVVIHAAVDFAYKLIHKNSFSGFIMEVLREIFDESNAEARVKSFTFYEPVQQDDNQEQSLRESECNSEGTLSSSSTLSEEEMAAMDGRGASVVNRKTDDESEHNSTPAVSSEADVLTLKTEKANLVLQRHRLIGQRDQAVRQGELLEAERIHKEIQDLQAKENELQSCVERLERNGGPPAVPNPLQTPENVRMQSRLISPILPALSPIVSRAHQRSTSIQPNRDSIFLNEAEVDEFRNNESMNADETGMHLSQNLRGIVLLTRYLSWENEISPYVKIVYDKHIFECLENEDYRVRMHAMYLMCIVGLIARTEARNSMAVFIEALMNEEEKAVRKAALKCFVDLLLKYDYSVFIMDPHDDENVIRNLPYPLNDLDVTDDQIRKEFMKILDLTSHPEDLTLNDLLVKVLAALKLLLRGRILETTIISWLFDLWMHPKYTGTPICKYIGQWLPIYASMSRERALAAARGMILSIKNICASEIDEDERREYAGKLRDFVLANIVGQNFELLNGLTLQEDVVLLLLMEINRDVMDPQILPLAKLLRSLKLETELSGKMARKLVLDILEAMNLTGPTNKEVSAVLKLLRSFKASVESEFGVEEDKDGDDNHDDEENVTAENLNEENEGETSESDGGSDSQL